MKSLYWFVTDNSLKIVDTLWLDNVLKYELKCFIEYFISVYLNFMLTANSP